MINPTQLPYDKLSFPYQTILFNLLTCSNCIKQYTHILTEQVFKYHEHQQEIFNHLYTSMCRIYYTKPSVNNTINIIDGFDRIIYIITPNDIMDICTYPNQLDIPSVHLFLSNKSIIKSIDILCMDTISNTEDHNIH